MNQVQVLVLDPLISTRSSTHVEIGRQVKVGDTNFLKSYIFPIIKLEPPIMSKYTRIMTIIFPIGFYSIIWKFLNITQNH